MNKEEVTSFLNAPNEIYHPLSSTYLEVSNYGRIRNARDMQFFGEVKYMEDMQGILSGTIPVWSKDSVVPTLAPRTYFFYRSRREREEKRARELEAERLFGKAY